MKYQDFIQNKAIKQVMCGHDPSFIPSMLFDFQRDIVAWAIRKGRAAIFADCGMGKTPMQLSWARDVCNHTKQDVLILAPLAVSKQTRLEGEKFGINVTICESQDDVRPGINITNYEKIHHFNTDHFVGVVLDESSIIKHATSKTRDLLIDLFRLIIRIVSALEAAVLGHRRHIN